MIWARDLPMAQQIGIDRVGGMPLAGARVAIHRRDPHARHQGAYALAPNRVAFSPEQVPQHAGSGKRMVQMELGNPTHQRQLCGRHRCRRVVRGRPREFQERAWPHNGQFVSSVDPRVALTNPALMSACSQQSCSRASCPIFAWRVLRSGISDVGFVPPHTSAARASNCGVHSVTGVGWM
jgi:hypothetical protein